MHSSLNIHGTLVRSHSIRPRLLQGKMLLASTPIFFFLMKQLVLLVLGT